MRFIYAILLSLFFTPFVFANTGNTIEFQGRLLDANLNPKFGSFDIRASLWMGVDAPDGSESDISGNLWTEVHTIVLDNQGKFILPIGDILPLPNPLSISIYKFLQIDAKPTAGGPYVILDPNPDNVGVDRHALSSVAFSQNAKQIEGRTLGFSSTNIPYLDINGELPDSVIQTTLTSLQADISSNTSAITNNAISIGSKTYTTNNFVSDGESITDSIDAIDIALANFSSSSLKDIDGDTEVTLEQNIDEDFVRILTNGVERFTIDSTGNVGIGTTTLTSLLNVNGDISFSGELIDSNGNNGSSNQVLVADGLGKNTWSSLLLDEDDFISDSDTQGATQQSVQAFIESKGYIDSTTVTAITQGEINMLKAGVPIEGDTLIELYNAIQSLTGGVQLQPITWDPATGIFPSGSQKGFWYYANNSGVIDGILFQPGDSIIALVDSASTTTFTSNWFKIEKTVPTPIANETAYYQTKNLGQTTLNNTVAPETVSWNVNPTHNSNNTIFLPHMDGVQVLSDGDYEIHASLYQESLAIRTNVSIQIAVNGVPTGIIGASAYKRVNNGHTEASSHVYQILTLLAGDIVSIQARGIANTGIVTTPLDTSILSVKAALSSFSGGGGTSLLDEDDFISDSDTQGATQQSIKAYINDQATPTPFVTSINPFVFYAGQSKTIFLEGENFTPNTNISIPGFDGTIDTVTVLSPQTLEITLTGGVTTGTYDLIVDNAGKLNTTWSGNGNNLIEIRTYIPWTDLRLGGATFTDGNAPGNDIRYRNGMLLSRDANGMYFTGKSPWSSWVKFESLGWTRGDEKILQWIITRPETAMMVGIGSDATNENSNSQLSQAEVEIYFNSSTNLWGLYGNTGIVGIDGELNENKSIIGGTGVYKIKIESDGDIGDTVTIYELPSSAPGDWEDESTVLKTYIISGTLNPDEPNLMPFIIPEDGGAQRFLAVKVE